MRECASDCRCSYIKRSTRRQQHKWRLLSDDNNDMSQDVLQTGPSAYKGVLHRCKMCPSRAMQASCQ